MAEIVLNRFEAVQGTLAGLCIECGDGATQHRSRTFTSAPNWAIGFIAAAYLVATGWLPILILSAFYTSPVFVWLWRLFRWGPPWLMVEVAFWGVPTIAWVSLCVLSLLFVHRCRLRAPVCAYHAEIWRRRHLLGWVGIFCLGLLELAVFLGRGNLIIFLGTIMLLLYWNRKLMAIDSAMVGAEVVSATALSLVRADPEFVAAVENARKEVGRVVPTDRENGALKILVATGIVGLVGFPLLIAVLVTIGSLP